MSRLSRRIILAVLAFVAFAVCLHAKKTGYDGVGAVVALGLIGLAAIDSLGYRLGLPSVLAFAGATLSPTWPLQSDNGNNPTVNPGQTISFKYLDVPDRMQGGPLANYLPGTILTWSGQIVQSGGTGVNITSDILPSMLFSGLDWIQSWYGAPMRATDVKGAHWHVLEWFASGYKYMGTQRGVVAGSVNGTYPFEYQIFVPANTMRHKHLYEYTMNLALLYRSSQLKVNAAQTTVLTSFSPGASFTNLKLSASAVLAPRQKIMLGTPIEMALAEPTVNSAQVIIPGFGNDTGLTGIDAGGGIAGLLELSAVLNQGGSLVPFNITSYAFPWRGQALTLNILDAFLAWKSQLPQRFVNNLANVASSLPAGTAFLMGPPYSITSNNGFGATTTQQNIELINLLFWALVLYSEDALELTDLQSANGDESYTATGTLAGSGVREIVSFNARSWQANMVRQWIQQVLGAGLYDYVFPGQSGKPKCIRPKPFGRQSVTGDQLRYLPYALQPSIGHGDIEARENNGTGPLILAAA